MAEKPDKQLQFLLSLTYETEERLVERLLKDPSSITKINNNRSRYGAIIKTLRSVSVNLFFSISCEHHEVLAALVNYFPEGTTKEKVLKDAPEGLSIEHQKAIVEWLGIGGSHSTILSLMASSISIEKRHEEATKLLLISMRKGFKLLAKRLLDITVKKPESKKEIRWCFEVFSWAIAYGDAASAMRILVEYILASNFDDFREFNGSLKHLFDMDFDRHISPDDVAKIYLSTAMCMGDRNKRGLSDFLTVLAFYIYLRVICGPPSSFNHEFLAAFFSGPFGDKLPIQKEEPHKTSHSFEILKCHIKTAFPLDEEDEDEEDSRPLDLYFDQIEIKYYEVAWWAQTERPDLSKLKG